MHRLGFTDTFWPQPNEIDVSMPGEDRPTQRPSLPKQPVGLIKTGTGGPKAGRIQGVDRLVERTIEQSNQRRGLSETGLGIANKPRSTGFLHQQEIEQTAKIMIRPPGLIVPHGEECAFEDAPVWTYAG
jgi:hypothetical protein